MMFPTYKALAASIDDFEKRLDFIMVKILIYSIEPYNLKIHSCHRKNTKPIEVKKKRTDSVIIFFFNKY